MSTVDESFLVGLVGDGVLPSLTPPMHEAEADAHGVRYLYRPLDLSRLSYTPEQIGPLLRAAGDLGFNALNITHPCKQLVLDELDEVSEDAARLGAVNTVLLRDGRFIGHNTDFSGFAAALAEGLPGAALDRVVLLGAGGAGAAVSYATLAAGAAELTIVDLDAARAVERAATLRGFFPRSRVTAADTAELPELLTAATGFIHATPVGMHQHPGIPVEASLLRPELWVADVVYRPLDTELVIAARALGCRVLDGGFMAVGQAADAFALITGLDPDRQRMREHFLRLIRSGR
ncbi:shikimate dehydrogenase [Klugiella xanthotipulae]|uniref:Shikimate dehydrogenase n=1 Tax=Klugiella xanthotipulae TaxID=244735 RepID=A0A543HTF6_9MICO|nr:shikimate dehydrogenase [Klugiella xanthotipulae]TQM61570.1 shikimate dehydrogenase [Klugiella xanthotipulae]